jgi:hypothetical protein
LKKLWLLLLIAGLFCTACANTDAKLRAATARLIDGINPNQVTVYDVDRGMLSVDWKAQTPKGEYICKADDMVRRPSCVNPISGEQVSYEPLKRNKSYEESYTGLAYPLEQTVASEKSDSLNQVVDGDGNDSMLPEVKNLKVSQIGDNAVAIYDLVGVAGVREAEVTVAITIDGDRRTAERLSLTGDFGKGVKVGLGKKIIWNAMADVPSDFDGELNWDVKAVSVSAPVKKVKKATKKAENKEMAPASDSDEKVAYPALLAK